MDSKKIKFLLSLFFVCMAAYANPVIIKKENYTVLISRPVDVWEGDSGSNSDTLSAFEDKKVGYTFFDDAGKEHAGQYFMFFASGPNPEDPVAMATDAKLKKYHHSFSRMPRDWLIFSRPVSVPPGQFSKFVSAQKIFRNKVICLGGDPRNASSKVLVSKILGGIASIGLYALTAGKYNQSVASGVMLDGKGADDTMDVFKFFGRSMTISTLPDIDFSSSSKIVVRRVSYMGNYHPGQVVIAYNINPTVDVENDALSDAIAESFGFSETKEQIEAARQSDYQDRISIWDGCPKK